MTNSTKRKSDLTWADIGNFQFMSESKVDNPNATKPQPLYMNLIDFIREKIYSKEWQSNKKLPSEYDLMRLFGISRGTVRKALKNLVNEGLLVQIQGSGTYVAEPGISHPAGERPLSFADSLRRQGKKFKTHVIDKLLTNASSEVAHELGVSPGDQVMFMRRVRTVNNEPIMCQESWLNLGVCPGLFDHDFTKEPLFDAVQSCSGKKIKTSHMRYSARTAGSEYATLLACEETAALLLLEQNISLEDGITIEWTHTWFKPGQSIIGIAVQSDK